MTKRRYVISTEDMLAIAQASRPRLLSIEDQRTPQQMADREWKRVGDKMGFDWATVERNPKSRDPGYILATPKEGSNV